MSATQFDSNNTKSSPLKQEWQAKQPLDAAFWQSKWDRNETQWRNDERSDQPFVRNAKWILNELQIRAGVSSPKASTLREIFAGSTVFIPMCGDSLVLGFWAKELACKVIGVDIVGDSLRASIQEQFPDRQLGEQGPDANGITCFELPATNLKEGSVMLLKGDIFSILRNATAYLEHVDIVYDRASLVAIAPDRRALYIKLMCDLLTIRKSETSENANLFAVAGANRTHKVMFLNAIERPFDGSMPDAMASPTALQQGPPYHIGENEVLEAFTTAIGSTTRYVAPVGSNRSAFEDLGDFNRPAFVDAFYVIVAHSNEHLMGRPPQSG